MIAKRKTKNLTISDITASDKASINIMRKKLTSRLRTKLDNLGVAALNPTKRLNYTSVELADMFVEEAKVSLSANGLAYWRGQVGSNLSGLYGKHSVKRTTKRTGVGGAYGYYTAVQLGSSVLVPLDDRKEGQKQVDADSHMTRNAVEILTKLIPALADNELTHVFHLAYTEQSKRTQIIKEKLKKMVELGDAIDLVQAIRNDIDKD